MLHTCFLLLVQFGRPVLQNMPSYHLEVAHRRKIGHVVYVVGDIVSHINSHLYGDYGSIS